MVSEDTGIRARGDATAEQRAELRTLIGQKAVPPAWVTTLYDDIRAADGLSATRAAAALIHLHALPDRIDLPGQASDDQAAELRLLVRTRIVPSPTARRWLGQLDTAQLTYRQAGIALAQARQMARRRFVIPVQGTPRGPAPDGRFALIGADERVHCYRIHTLTASWRRVVEDITGGEPRKLTGMTAQQVLRAVAADPAAAADRYQQNRAKEQA